MRILQVLLVTMALAVGAWGQTQPVTGTITTASAGPGNCVSTRAQNNSIVGIDVSGTFTGLTLQPTVQILSTSSAPTRNKKVQALDGTLQATITAAGGYKATISGWTQFNVCATALSTGSAVVSLFATPAGDNTLLGSSWTQVGGFGGVGTGVLVGANATHANMFYFMLQTPSSTANLTVDVTTADNSANTYDFCIYSGTPSATVSLLAHTGAVAGSAINSGGTGLATIPWASPATLPAGRYYLVMFGNEASPTLQIGGAASLELFYHNAAQSITPSSGACPATTSSSADALSQAAAPLFVLN